MPQTCRLAFNACQQNYKLKNNGANVVPFCKKYNIKYRNYI